MFAPKNTFVYNLVLLNLTTVLYLFLSLHQYEPYTFTKYDPGWMVHSTISLVEDLDLDLRNQLSLDPQALGGQIALGVSGQWYPIHEPVISVLAIPFYLAFDIPGFLLFNLLLCVLLVLQVSKISSLFVAPRTALLAGLLFALSPIMRAYSYSFSTDVLGALFMSTALYYFLTNRFYLSGLWSGIAVTARITTCPMACALFLIALLFHLRGTKKIVRDFCYGASVPAVLFVLFNWICFGDPFTLPYDRQAVVAVGGQVVVAPSSVFQMQDFLMGAFTLVADSESGFFVGAPWLLVSLPLGAWLVFKRGSAALLLPLVIPILAQALFSAVYSGFPGSIGNRYMFASYCLGAVLTAIVIEHLLRKIVVVQRD